jgi:hypothetical protein
MQFVRPPNTLMEGCGVDSQGILIRLTQGVTAWPNAPEHDGVDSQQGPILPKRAVSRKPQIGRLLSKDALSGYCGFIGLLIETFVRVAIHV